MPPSSSVWCRAYLGCCRDLFSATGEFKSFALYQSSLLSSSLLICAFPLLFGCYDDSYVIFDPVYLLSCLSPSVVDLMGVALSFFVAVFATGSVDSAS